MGTSRKAVSQKRSILDIWCWEQKVFFFCQLAKAFDMGSRSFLYGIFANWVELFQLAKAFYMGN